MVETAKLSSLLPNWLKELAANCTEQERQSLKINREDSETMNTHEVITLARKHLGKGGMISSAEVCLADAIELYDAGKLDYAKARALKSIAYSVGVFNTDYIRAAK